MNQFTNLPINELLIKGINHKNYELMTEVQELVIPLALDGLDVLAQAPTGTGKTMAFAIPILETIDYSNQKPSVLIIAPTRELTMQISAEIEEVSQFMPKIKIATLYGGQLIDRQITQMKRKPQIVIATPGRLMDHIRRKTVDLSSISILVLDEADEMLNMGFREDIDEILKSVDTPHQTMLFSATITAAIENIAKSYLKEPKKIRLSKKELTVDTVSQKYIDVELANKVEVVSRLIDAYLYEVVMIFCNTKKRVDDVTSSFLLKGYIVEALHGDMKQMQRDRVMMRFRSGAINILVASDVAARGLDIDDIDVVFNFDIPSDPEYYIHRIGRTGRAKKEGLAISLVSKREKRTLRDIMAYTKADIQKMEIPSFEKVINLRLERLINETKEVDNPKLYHYVENLLSKEDINKDKLITNLIAAQLNIDNETFNKESLIVENVDQSKTTRLYIGLGTKDNLEVGKFVKLLLNKTSLSNRDINNIDMHSTFTFFDVPSYLVDEVKTAFNRDEKGRKIVVEEVRNKLGRRKTKEASPTRKNYNNKQRSKDNKPYPKKTKMRKR